MGLNITAPHSKSAVMEIQTLVGLAHTLQTVAIAALIFAACTFILKLRHRAQLAKLPSISGDGYLTSAKELYREGYQKAGPAQA
jgi:hypothetical protein